MLRNIAKLSLLVSSLALLGCSGSKPLEPTEDEYVKQKVEWMTKVADAIGQPDEEFSVRSALEKYRNTPFAVKAHPEAAQKILEIYNSRVKGKLKGDAAIEVAGEISLLTNEMK